MTDLNLDELERLLADFPELHMGNYNDEDVGKLNQWGIDVFLQLDALLAAARERDQWKLEALELRDELALHDNCVTMPERDALKAECERLRYMVVEARAALEEKP